MSDSLDVSKLKIPELRVELAKRGLDTYGTRQVLVDRLSEALSASEQKSNEKNPANLGPENGCPNRSGDVDSRQRPESDLKRRHSSSRSPRRRSRSRSRDRDYDRERDRDRDSRRSPRRRSRSPVNRTKVCEEPDGWERSELVFLDSYNCDLNLMVDADGFFARPQTDGGFSMMWAGVRSNYGLLRGRAFFEVRLVRNLSVDNLDVAVGGATHVMRVGWSTENSEFALGEEPQSYGFGGTGKKSCNNKFSDYGCTFGEGDVVGAFLEYTDSEAVLRFSVNGVDQGECFRVEKSTFGSRPALFPHVYVKNVEFSVNFGQNDQDPWFPPNIPGGK
ncbi:Heterogeneous nuclear ribonucleoprotein U protein 1 [Fasciolopsis buskii]|uniref:Heterogeneous nuclear ribonucleoprotein U protein 1 n=1 Tax=Fasciolopsis buskii TaxID=27845 RepID=A0A8E0RSV1_9TREM|nr:Heterogeneous nuclear ribonucleoprotein U protein 1 [Fasciolopsis buski]